MIVSPDLHLADGVEEVRLGARPDAGEVVLQAAEALRGGDGGQAFEALGVGETRITCAA